MLMKQLTVDILTSLLVIVNLFTGILSFVPAIFFPNFLITLIPLPISPLIISIILMAIGCLLDVIFQKSIMQSIIITALFAFAYWIITPNILLLAVFAGAIAFGQIILKEWKFFLFYTKCLILYLIKNKQITLNLLLYAQSSKKSNL